MGILEFLWNKGFFRDVISRNVCDFEIINKIICSKFDILISTASEAHSIVCKAQTTKQNRTIVISIPTDIDDISKGHIKNQNIFYCVYSDKHKELLKKANCPHYKQISGLPLRQEFVNIRRISKSDTKKELGFDPNKPVVMVSFGTAGNHETTQIAKLLENKQCILMCANNKELKAELEAIGNKKHRVEGFVDAEQMAKRMRAADAFIGKVGGCIIWEVIQCEAVFLPLRYMIYEIEKANLQFLIDKKLGIAIDDINEIPDAIDKAMADPTYKQALAKIQNNGAQEVATVVKDVLDNYEDWQDRLWGKRRIVLLREGTGGGHYEVIKPIELELKKRGLDKKWDIGNFNVEKPGMDFVGNKIIMRFFPGIKNILSSIDDLVGFSYIDNLTYPTGRFDIVIACVARNKVVSDHFKKNGLKIPFISMVSDFANFKKDAWLSNKENLYPLGTNLLLDQAKTLDLPHVVPTSGMVIRQEFKDVCKMSKAEAKEKMGFDANEPVICVCYGSAGYYKIRQLADMLKDKNAIIICAKYSEMKDELEKLGNKKHKILGYADTQTMATCLRASDVMIGKPGNIVISEAWQCECVPICEGGDIVMIQEKACEKDIRDNKRGIIVDRFEDIPAAIDEILRNPIYKRNCSAVYNNSLTQVCDVIQNVTENYGWWQDRLWGEGKSRIGDMK